MTLTEFENGYWYATDLKKFGKEIGIENSSKLRKDELEPLIKHYLKTGKVKKPKRSNINQNVLKDSEMGLTVNLPVRRFTNNTETWSFLEVEARRIDPHFKRKQGVKYRLNRWRDEQLTKGKLISYGDLAREYVKLNNSKKPFKRIQGTYYMYFLKDYMENEAHAIRKDGLKAWHELKKLDIPKTYKDWKAYTQKNKS